MKIKSLINKKRKRQLRLRNAVVDNKQNELFCVNSGASNANSNENEQKKPLTC
jgi:hypothetical protein